MNLRIEKIKFTLREDLAANKEIEPPVERLNDALKIIDRTISELRQFVENYEFKNNDEEIMFFKNIKPEVMAHKIEEGIKYNLVISKPIGTVEVQTHYYEEELRAFQSFFRLNSFHYQYYKNGLIELDMHYFLRRSEQLSVPPADIPETDKEFSTPMSYLFAKFIAYEHLQYFILEQLTDLKSTASNQLQKARENTGDLTWTGEAINIIEIAYGIWLTGQLNNGNASLTQIVRWLETSLKVTIGNIQSRFAEISSRKRLSPTKFLDQMKETIQKRIESSNA